MRVPFESLRENYRRASGGSAPLAGAFAFELAKAVGYVDDHGAVCLRADGAPGLRKDRAINPGDVDLQDLTEAVLGERWQHTLGLNTPGRQYPFRRLVREEAAAPIGPSHLFNFNAWTAAVGALLDARMLEGYETADPDGADLFPIRQAVYWNGGQRVATVIGPSEMAPPVGPGESHPDGRVDGMWVETLGPKKWGQKATITKESAFVDVTGGQAMQRALDVGYSIKLRESDLSYNALLGINTPEFAGNNFKLGLTADSAAVGYNTYGATVPAGNGATATLNNSIVNPMTDPFTTMQASEEELVKYVHPVTGLPMPVSADLNTVIVPTTLQWLANFLLGAQTISIGTIAGSPIPAIGGGTFPTSTVTNANPWAGRFRDVRVSQWLFTKLTAPTTSARPTIPVGKGLSAANAKRWYRLNRERFACRLQAWEMQTIDMAPNSYVMADQGIVAGRVGNIATTVQVLNPWAVQENKVV